MPALSVAGVRCGACGRVFVAPQYLCLACGAELLEPVQLGASGQLYSYTTVRVPPDAQRDQVPYHIGLIQLEAGLRVTARLQAAGWEPRIGSQVQLIAQNDHGYVFALVPAAGGARGPDPRPATEG